MVACKNCAKDNPVEKSYSIRVLDSLYDTDNHINYYFCKISCYEEYQKQNMCDGCNREYDLKEYNG